MADPSQGAPPVNNMEEFQQLQQMMMMNALQMSNSNWGMFFPPLSPPSLSQSAAGSSLPPLPPVPPNLMFPHLFLNGMQQMRNMQSRESRSSPSTSASANNSLVNGHASENPPNALPTCTCQNRVKKPMNAFLLWSRDARSNLKKEHPEENNSGIAKLLGQRWKTLSNEEKMPYYEEQEMLKDALVEKYPDYKLMPKRRCDACLSRKRKGKSQMKKRSTEELMHDPPQEAEAVSMDPILEEMPLLKPELEDWKYDSADENSGEKML